MWTANRDGHGPLARYVKLRVAHVPGMPGTFSPPPLISDPDMHRGTCVTHVPGCMPGSLISGFFWNQRRGKRSRHSRRMRNPQVYVSGKRPMGPHGTDKQDKTKHSQNILTWLDEFEFPSRRMKNYLQSLTQWLKFADDIFFNQKVWVAIQISLKFVTKGTIFSRFGNHNPFIMLIKQYPRRKSDKENTNYVSLNRWVSARKT